MPERPWGVTILGTLFAVNWAPQFLFFFLLFSGSLARALFAFSAWAWCAVFLLLSVSSFFVAFGLLLGEDWAWKLTLVVNIIYIPVTIGLFAIDNTVNHWGAAFLIACMHPAYLLLLSIVVYITPLDLIIPTNIDNIVSLFTFILPDIIVILYLMLPHVKAFFLGTESSIQKYETQNARANFE